MDRSVAMHGKGGATSKLLSMLLALVLVFGLLPAVPGVALAAEADTGAGAGQATTVTYSQADGFEPYQGWQDAQWDEASDPDYSSSGGTSRKGWPAWSLSDPLSVGVTDYDKDAQTLITGDSVKVVTDTKACKTEGEASYADPWYYKNVILSPYDVTGESISFTFNTVNPGGAGLQPDKVLKLGGFAIATSPDPSTWDGENSTVVWKAGNDDLAISQVRDNWWQQIKVTASTANLEAGKTYYFVLRNGTAGGWGRIYADQVFEFSADTGRTASWSGDLTAAGYGREQGNGGTKLGFTSPSPSTITTDLTKTSTVYYNTATKPVVLDADKAATFTIHADGSGSNWQLLSTWTGQCADKVKVYAEDPLANPSAEPVCTYADGTLGFSLVNPDRDWPTRDGLNITVKGLSYSKTYYLYMDASLQPQTTNPVGKPIVMKFATVGENSLERLTAEVASAQANLDAAHTSVDGSDVNQTDWWATAEAKATFKAAIDKAAGIAAGTPSEDEVKAALAELFSAQEAFDAAKQKGLVKCVVKEWQIGKAVASDAVATLWSDGSMVFSGGEAYVDDFNAPWKSQLDSIKTIRFEEGFSTASIMHWFDTSKTLETVENFPSGVTNMMYAFMDCPSLKSIPCLPETVSQTNQTFWNCVSLTELPAGFKVPAGKDFMIKSAETPVATTVSEPVDASVLDYDWAGSNRSLVVKGSEAKTALYATIAAAQVDAAGATVTDDPASKPSNFQCVTAEQKQALDDAIGTAKTAFLAQDATEEESSAANDALAAAVAAFDSAKQAGGLPFAASKGWEVGSPNTSDVTAWLADDGVLRFVGSGDVATFTNYLRVPWYQSREDITGASFDEGVAPTKLDYFFYGCSNLKGAEIPASVTSLKTTFGHCTSLVEAPAIPASVTSLRGAFSNCTSLADAPAIPEGVTDMSYAFNGCTSLVEAPAIPASVTSLSNAFGFTSLVVAPAIPEGVTDMSYAFNGCTSLVEAPAIPASVTSLSSAFTGCTSLVVAPEIPEGVTYMSYAFDGCTALVEAPSVPSGVKKMQYAFRNCPSLVLSEGFSLPDGFKPSSVSFKGAFSHSESCVLDTVYLGELSDSVKALDWEGLYNRRLVKPATSDELSSLLSLSEIAKGKIEGVSASVDGTDVASDAKWDSSEAVEAMNNAIAAAEKFLGTDAPVSQPGVQQAKKDLESAVRALSPKAGLLATADSVSSLRALAASAKLSTVGVVESADGTDVAQGTLWVTPGSKAAVDAAIAAAQAEIAKELPQQVDVDAAYAALVDAVEAFNPEYGTYVAPEPVDYSCGFYDVATELAAVADPANVWYVKGGYLAYVSGNGLIKGYEGTTLFGTHDQITRAQLATILCRAAGAGDEAAKATVDTTGLSDIAAGGAWYTGYVNWAFDNGVVAGNDDGTFRPDDPVTREEMAVMIARYAKAHGADVDGASLDSLKTMSDWKSISAWARQSVAWCAENGVLTGVDLGGEFQAQPQRSAERIEAAKVVTVLLRDVLV